MDNYEVEYTNFCVEAILKGKPSYRNGREYITYKNKTVVSSRALWNYWHTDDPLKETDVVHHKDGDKTNNSIENLVKMNAGEHMALHRKNPVRNNKQRQAAPRPEYYKTKVMREQEDTIKRQEEEIKELKKEVEIYKAQEMMIPSFNVSTIWLAKENTVLKRLIKNNMDPLSLRDLIKEAEIIVKEEFKELNL
jgi:hypothetical protein